jgi:hypothetical protein
VIVSCWTRPGVLVAPSCRHDTTREVACRVWAEESARRAGTARHEWWIVSSRVVLSRVVLSRVRAVSCRVAHLAIYTCTHTKIQTFAIFDHYFDY